MSSNKTLRGCGCSFRGSPALRSLPAATSSSKGPNLILGDSDGGEAMGIPSGSWRILAPFLRRKQNKRNSFSDLNTNPKLTRNKHAAHCRIQANWIFCAHQGWPRDGGTETYEAANTSQRVRVRSCLSESDRFVCSSTSRGKPHGEPTAL